MFMKMESCLYVPECAYEWDPNEVEEEKDLWFLIAMAHVLLTSDTITVIKDLRS